jgi:alpha-1,2-mannosyltransferase
MAALEEKYSTRGRARLRFEMMHGGAIGKIMRGILESGSWLSEQRLRVYPLMLLSFAVVTVAAMAATAHGRFDATGHQLGTDFSQVWVAGLETLRGHPEEPFDVARHIGEQRAEFGENSDVYGWHYPPFFLAPAALLAHLSYLQALAVWQIAALSLYLTAVVAILRDSGLPRARIVVTALAFPAVLINLGHGQNGSLTAALLGGGFLLLERRPLLAGTLLALLAYKPQFGLVIPAALIAGRHWRAFASAAVTLALMTVATVAAFGLESWVAFARSLAFTREFVIEQGAAGFEKIQSVFAGVRLIGGGVQTAYAAQAVVTLLALAAVVLLWRSNADRRIKGAAAIMATLLTTPYCLDYDMMALGPVIALMTAHGVENGFGPFEKTCLVLAFAAPLVARPLAMLLPLPIGALTMMAVFALIVWNARRDEVLAASKPFATS